MQARTLLQPGEEAIHGWHGNYGKRGQLREYILETVKSRAPEFVTTTEMALLVIMEFSLVFTSDESYRTWYNDSLRGTLKALTNLGHLERDRARETRAGQPVGWRWRDAAAPTLAQLSRMT